jgi:preprotein translocase subunit SecD
VAVTLPDVTGQEAWLSIIKESAGTRQDQWTLSRSGNALTLVLSDAERTLLVNNAVTQNLSILKKRINELGIVEASVVRQGRTASASSCRGAQPQAGERGDRRHRVPGLL